MRMNLRKAQVQVYAKIVLNEAVCRNHRIKRVVQIRCRTDTLKNPTKCLLRWQPDRRYTFSPPALLCRHIYD